MSPKSVSTEAWLSGIGAVIVATAVIVTFAYANFETKEHAKERESALQEGVQRELKTINDKLDVLGGWMPKRKPGSK